MKKKYINELKYYRNLLILYKISIISSNLSNEVENKIPTITKSKQKVLSIYKNR